VKNVSQEQTQTQEITLNQIRKEFEVEKIVDDRKEHYKYVVEFNEEEEGKSATLEIYWYPIYPYGNYVKKVITITEKDGNIVFEGYVVRNSWNGTGRDNKGKIIMRDVFEESPFILRREFYEEIDSAEEFEQKVKEIIEFVKEYAELLNPLPLF
jgi:hypothetical protein